MDVIRPRLASDVNVRSNIRAGKLFFLNPNTEEETTATCNLLVQIIVIDVL